MLLNENSFFYKLNQLIMNSKATLLKWMAVLVFGMFSFIPNASAVYCTGGPSSTYDSNVTNVTLNGIVQNIAHTGCPGVTGLQDLTYKVADVTPGGTYSVSVTWGTCGGTYSGAGSVWIDWNANEVYEATELVGSWSGSPNNSVPYTYTFTVPATANLGTTRMRVMQRESGSLPLDPCGSYTWGSNMDFGILVRVVTQGDLHGYVFNGQGLTINGAYVGIQGVGGATTGPDGHYMWEDAPGNTQTVTCYKEGYNLATQTVNIVVNGLTQLDWVLTRPNLIINPLILDETVNPNEYLTRYLGLLNNGDGLLAWNAEIIFPSAPQAPEYPHYGMPTSKVITGEVANPMAITRQGANDEVIGNTANRDFGDVVMSFVPAGNQPWGCGWDGEKMWVTNPFTNPGQIVAYNLDGTQFGQTIPASFGGSWVGDMDSDETYLYGCNVGGDNGIKKIDLATGSLVATITGAFAVTSQRGLAYDADNDEYYIGGWNSNMIWRVTSTGATISQYAWNGVSGLAWHPQGGPDGDGSLYIVANTPTDQVTEVDPNNGWMTLQAFMIPGGVGYSGAGLDINDDGNLWVVNQSNSNIYLVDTEQPLSGGWLTLDAYAGEVLPNGGTYNLGTNFDATGHVAGEILTANIIFTTSPNVGTINIPVTMRVAGPALYPCDNLEAVLINPITGQVNMSWTFNPEITFEYFVIERNGTPIATTTNNTFTDFLPTYGVYSYTVAAVFAEGQTVPAGPVSVFWLIPDLCYNPAAPINYQWPSTNEPVLLTLTNCGEGVLAYTFPDYAAQQLLADPNVKKNNTEVTPSMINAANLPKGSVEGDGQGQPIVLGAGGPDAFGSVWIDSDEPGGPTFNWIEIAGLGTDHGLSGDDNYVQINLPFAFPFYDVPQTTLRASTNGYLTFGTSGTTYSNTGIPVATQPNNMIAMFWDDLNFTGAAKLYSYFDVANNYFVIEYQNVPKLGSSSLNTFEVILYPSGAIKMQYLSMTGTLNSATVGIEDAAGAIGLQVAFNTTYLKNNLAVYYSVPATFIIDVEPAFGTINEGQSQDVIMTYSSIDYADPGTYNQDLILETNELAPGDYHSIPNTMVVYTPGRFFGNVHDGNTNAPINQAYVTAVSMFGSYQTTTNANGNYGMYVDEDVYDVIFDKLGYQTVIVADTFAQAGINTEVSVAMYETPYPPAGVIATVIDNDTKVRVDWMLPEPVYEILYDDGHAEDYAMWLFSGGANAVKFTPSGYPLQIMGGRVYVGDGSFPANANFLGSSFGIAVHAADGENGMPGTTLDSIEVTVNNYGWVTFYGLNATIESGNFYLAMYQGGTPPNAAPIGIDVTPPTAFRSYSKMSGGSWMVSSFQDFMFRAIVSSPILAPLAPETSEVVIPTKASAAGNVYISQNGTPMVQTAGTVKNGEVKMVDGMNDERSVVNYQVARVAGFDPAAGETPEDGTLTILATTTNLTYTDNGYNNLPMGWYAYAVRAKYTNNDYSIWVYSNLVPRLLDVAVTINVTCCDGEEPSGAEVSLVARNYPFTNYFAVTDATGTVVFDSVFKGYYNLYVDKVGYQVYDEQDIYTFAPWTRDVVLAENAYAPRNFTVDPLSSIGTWDEPLVIKLMEDFEGNTFPPAGWQKFQAEGPGWERKSGAHGSTDWPVPAGDGFFAIANDDLAGSTNDGSMDYLITPAVDLRESDSFMLYFDQYYTGAFGQLAILEYSTDGGASWEEIQQMSPGTAWTPVQVNLAAFSGLTGERAIMFAFHSDDAGQWASGWAVDNVEVSNGTPEVLGYMLYLNDGLVAEVAADIFEYQYQDLTFGQTYVGAVAAKYACGISPKVYFTWQSTYLYPPRNLESNYVFGTNEVPLRWNPPMEGPGIFAPAFTGTIIPGNYATSTGQAPLNAVPVAGYEEEAIGFENYRGSIMYGIKNNAPANYISLDIDVPGTLTNIAPFTGSGFSNATEFQQGSTTIMYEVDNVGGVREVDVVAGTVTSLGNTIADVTGMAKDPTTGIYYLCTGGDVLYTFDVETLTATPVGSMGSNLMIGITCDAEGNLWGYDIGADMFYSIDKATGAGTVIGSIGFDANFGQGLGYDQATDQLIMSAYNNTAGQAQLRVVDKTTGASTLIGALGPGGTQVASICAPTSGTPGPGGGDVPDGLLAFKVYRDGDFVADVPYNGEEVDEWINYIENQLMPGTYEYTVTAVYDLAAYNRPGETAESMIEGPVTVEVVFGFELPFYEDFAGGTFELNDWTTSGPNWRVAGQTGNGAPSAEFTWDPLITDGNSALRSYPLLGYGMTEGDIWLDFDVKLNDRFATGNEKLQVQVYDGAAWTTVFEFANNGSFGWTSKHLKITDQAMGKVFMVRFNAACTVSSDLVSWFVDNVAVYRQCASPEDLTGEEVNANGTIGIRLGWVAPEVPLPIAEWIKWDSGTNFSGIGLTDGGDFTVAARWDAGQLNEFNGTSITKVRIFPQDDGFGTLTVKVWKGANAATLLASKLIAAPVVGMWNEVTLDTPITLDVASELWVGYSVAGQVAGKFPAGTDEGPAVTGYGDMISLDGVSWDALSEIAPTLSYNWNVEAYVQELGFTTPSTPLVDDMVYNNTSVQLARGEMKEVGVSANNDSERMLGGFNIYRSVNNGAYELYDFVPYIGTLNYTYLDPASEGLVIGSTYCYKVTSVWESETDYCESPAALAAEPASPGDDFICVLYTNVNEISEVMTQVYPNPAKDLVNINSGSSINRITVINYVGQVVYDVEVSNQTKVELNVAGYEAGVYMVKIATTEGTVTKRVTIVR